MQNTAKALKLSAELEGQITAFENYMIEGMLSVACIHMNMRAQKVLVASFKNSGLLFKAVMKMQHIV